MGAWVSATYMPTFLRFIFQSVANANMQEQPGIPTPDRTKKQNPGGQGGSTTSGEAGATTGTASGATTGATTGENGPDQPGGTTGTNSSGSQTTGKTAEQIYKEGLPGSRKTVLTDDYDTGNPAILAAMALLGAIVGGALGNIFVTIWQRSVLKWDRLEMGDKVSLFIGIFAGIVASTPFFIVFQGLGGFVQPLLTFALVLGFSSVSILALRSMEDVLPWHRSVAAGKRTGRKLLDTNVIIDGRILDVARTGFLEGEIYIPKFVIDELQYIADSPDALRRQRGRRGLEVLRLLQADYNLTIGAEDERVSQAGEVDDRLVQLAKVLGGDIVSNDFNLNRVAGLQKVKVLNINDLALSLRPNVLPGEHLTVSLIREGSQHGQGIGYLDDGTMVVVDNGKMHIGETVDSIVTQVIQTERGKMIFADSALPVRTERA